MHTLVRMHQLYNLDLQSRAYEEGAGMREQEFRQILQTERSTLHHFCVSYAESTFLLITVMLEFTAIEIAEKKTITSKVIVYNTSVEWVNMDKPKRKCS